MGVDSSEPASFILPANLLTCCNYPLTYHPNGDEIAKQSVEWLESSCPDLSTQGRRALLGLQAGNFVAFCYNTASSERLRVVSDFANYLFFLDNISDGMVTQESDVKTLSEVVMEALSPSDVLMHTTSPEKKRPAEDPVPGKLARDFWARCIADAGPGMQERFKEAFKLFFRASHIQAKGRDEGIIPDLETYINLRRDTSACKCCWALIERACNPF
ncbi:Alpha-muurolene synthase [Termitomyces sp. T159_Od127]|nr:Alpha-muurolene synthase [Termitomyces sp. T159_Od127]